MKWSMFFWGLVVGLLVSEIFQEMVAGKWFFVILKLLLIGLILYRVYVEELGI